MLQKCFVALMFEASKIDENTFKGEEKANLRDGLLL